MHWIYFMRLHF